MAMMSLRAIDTIPPGRAAPSTQVSLLRLACSKIEKGYQPGVIDRFGVRPRPVFPAARTFGTLRSIVARRIRRKPLVSLRHPHRGGKRADALPVLRSRTPVGS